MKLPGTTSKNAIVVDNKRIGAERLVAGPPARANGMGFPVASMIRFGGFSRFATAVCDDPRINLLR